MIRFLLRFLGLSCLRPLSSFSSMTGPSRSPTSNYSTPASTIVWADINQNSLKLVQDVVQAEGAVGLGPLCAVVFRSPDLACACRIVDDPGHARPQEEEAHRLRAGLSRKYSGGGHAYGGVKWQPTDTITSSSAPARPAACWPTGCPRTAPRACSCSKPAAATGTLTSTSRSAWAACTNTACSTGATRPIPSRTSTAGASRRCAARSWAARPRSTSWPIRAAIPATTTAGRRRARAAGPMRTCCPISAAARPGKTAPTPGAAAKARSAPNSPRPKTRSTTPGSRPPRPAAIRSRRITTASSRKVSAAASTPSATAGARRRRTRFSSRRADGKI